AAILEQIEKNFLEVSDAVKFLTSYFSLEARLIANLPVMAVAATYLRLLQNLKSHAQFFISTLASLETQIV
ncbi:MAG: hypothetical protein ONB05_12495, partial [candidate division KSB1 bacterium]|nr:hypothetical protein [candidate division KSB1 bacterium]